MNRNLSLLAAFFSLIGCAIMTFGSLLQLAPLILLKDSQYLNVFNVEQLRALSQLFLELSFRAGHLAVIFFGFYCLLPGYLILKSAFLPRMLGVPMAFAGLGWLTFLSTPFANNLSPYNLVLGILAEGSHMRWLLVKGVNVERWQEQAGAIRIKSEEK